MKKNFLLIAVIVMAFTLQTTKGVAQEFTIGSTANITSATIVVPVTCKNFIQYPGWQGSINWDNTKLTYASFAAVASQFSNISYNATVSNTTGRLSFVWADNGGNPQTIPDNTVLFNITFNVVPLAVGSTDITFTNTPTPLLLSSASFTAVSGVTYTKGTATLTGILPISILSFTATPQNNTILTQWHTTNEVNVSHINVQRSIDGNSFTTIGSVGAKGGGDYSFVDANLPTAITKLYYRLESVDKDGSKQYSKVVTVNLNTTLHTLTIFPNPVKATLSAQVTTTTTEKVVVQITDMQGKLLQQQLTQLQVGNNTININAGNLTNGTYVLLINGDTKLQKRFVKE